MDTAAPTTTSNNHNTPNPPSIELAYKKKCIQLKKRLNEIEAENELVRARNKRAKLYVAKMRLETCIMLERLATVTGMLDEAASAGAAGGSGQQGGGQISAELRAKAAAIVTSAHAQSIQGVMDDETEGSSEEQPPTVCLSFFFF
jgi:solute carrier family 25 phosphate transporter 3